MLRCEILQTYLRDLAHELTDVLSRERVEMGAIAQTLDLQAAKVVDTIVCR